MVSNNKREETNMSNLQIYLQELKPGRTSAINESSQQQHERSNQETVRRPLQDQHQDEEEPSSSPLKRPTMVGQKMSFVELDNMMGSYLTSFYLRPSQRHRWDETMAHPHTNWRNTFFDLFYVAAAYSLGHLIHDDLTSRAILYFAGLFFPISLIWVQKLYYDARYHLADDVFHRCYEIAGLLLLGTAVWNIRTVEIMEDVENNPEMFVFCLSVFLSFLLGWGRYLELILCCNQRGTSNSAKSCLHPETYFQSRRDLVLHLLPVLMCLAAAIYSREQYAGNLWNKSQVLNESQISSLNSISFQIGSPTEAPTIEIMNGSYGNSSKFSTISQPNDEGDNKTIISGDKNKRTRGNDTTGNNSTKINGKSFMLDGKNQTSLLNDTSYSPDVSAPVDSGSGIESFWNNESEYYNESQSSNESQYFFENMESQSFNESSNDTIPVPGILIPGILDKGVETINETNLHLATEGHFQDPYEKPSNESGQIRKLAEQPIADEPAVSHSKGTPNDIPIFLLLGSICACALTMVFNAIVINIHPNGKSMTVPLNIDFCIHRFGEWTMLLLGEGVLSLLIVPQSQRDFDYLVTFFCGLLTIIILQRIHFRSQPTESSHHAFRRNSVVSASFVIFYQVYSASLLLIGVCYKMFLYEYIDDSMTETHGQGTTGESHRMLFSPYRSLSGSSGNSELSSEERQLTISRIFSISMALAWFSLDCMSLLHIGLDGILPRFQLVTLPVDIIIVAMILMRTGLIVVFAIMAFYEQRPENLAYIGLSGAVAQLLLRFVGTMTSPPYEIGQGEAFVDAATDFTVPGAGKKGASKRYWSETAANYVATESQSAYAGGDGSIRELGSLADYKSARNGSNSGREQGAFSEFLSARDGASVVGSSVFGSARRSRAGGTNSEFASARGSISDFASATGGGPDSTNDFGSATEGSFVARSEDSFTSAQHRKEGSLYGSVHEDEAY